MRRPSICKNNEGFTLIEVLVVIALLAIMSAAALPRLTSFFNTAGENTAIATTLIVRAFDDAFIHDSINYLAVHLAAPPEEEETDDASKEIFTRRNAISVLKLKDGVFVDSSRQILKSRQFPDSFRIEQAILSSGELVTSGSVLVPFYPAGYSDNVLLHVLINNQRRISIKIRKYMKEPEVIEDYIAFNDAELETPDNEQSDDE